MRPHRFVAAAALLLPLAASAQPAPAPAPADPAGAADPAGGVVVDLDDQGVGSQLTPLQSRGEGLTQGGREAAPAAAAVRPPAPAPAFAGPVSAARLPASLDRSSWSLPSGSPAPVEGLSLWSEDCYRCAVEDRFERDPLGEPSVHASLEAALATYAGDEEDAD